MSGSDDLWHCTHSLWREEGNEQVEGSVEKRKREVLVREYEKMKKKRWEGEDLESTILVNREPRISFFIENFTSQER